MILSDIECECGAQYRCAESETLDGDSGSLQCANCGRVVEEWKSSHKRVYRCVMAPDRAYPAVSPPPAP